MEWHDVRADWSLAKTVHEADRKPVDTGLLDASGTKLYRVEPANPFGFLQFSPETKKPPSPKAGGEG
jgi:hypothetical protein